MAAPTGKPPVEAILDAPLVRALLEEQHPDLAHLSIVLADEGWDNMLFRLGHDLVVRMPRRALAASLVAREQRWLPDFAPQLPLPVPAPLRVGHPGCGYPWAWSITRWFDGQSALAAPPHDLDATARVVGEFLRALHRPAPADAPPNPWRGVPLHERTESFHHNLDRIASIVDQQLVRERWNQVVSARPWPGPPLWIHGDLHPGNLVVDDGRVIAVVDFGDLTAGDPATDLAIMWALLPPTLHPRFLDAVSGATYRIDEDMVMRSRGWAMSFAVAVMASEGDHTPLGALSRRTLEEIVFGGPRRRDRRGDGSGGP
jgi:aminoglycoside phosphotransferase (APT) family kinase protein